uniref:Uncharacterized protein n=1 Tax=Rhizophora mucronata TaxID=61149 RepID=A0A2P2QIW0_RHIMU
MTCLPCLSPFCSEEYTIHVHRAHIFVMRII